MDVSNDIDTTPFVEQSSSSKDTTKDLDLETASSSSASISSILSVARNRGLLKLEDKDKKDEDFIVYRDQFGRKLNKNEAWKYMNHQIHGIKSGVNKKAKNIRNIQIEEKRKHGIHTVEKKFQKIKQLQKKNKSKFIEI